MLVAFSRRHCVETFFGNLGGFRTGCVLKIRRSGRSCFIPSALNNSVTGGLCPLAAGSPHPTILSVAWMRRLHILLLHLGDLVALVRLALRIDVNLVNPRRVQADYLGFDLMRELLVAVFLRDIITNLEAPQPLNL